jgi:superfamily II DNA or RNA helicase
MSDAQRGPYQEQQHTLARLLQNKYLSEIDRRRILCCITNLRMLCDSTYLLDKQTNVSPKLDEFAELLSQLLGAGPHKVVVFSQWEQMLHEAAAVLEKQDIAYVLLHGNVPGKARRALIERFRDDEDCRVFLSTDVGGTGLNLQSADTVVNLEVPWNPAVLEQRIARVHRLGQHRPVQVFNLVTRDSIEERVLRTLDRKRSLFSSVFTGTSDEIIFGTLGHQAFLETVRSLVAEEARENTERGTRNVELTAATPNVAETPPQVDSPFATAAIQFLEALAAVGVQGLVTTDKEGRAVLQVALPSADVLRRGAAALRAIVRGLEGTGEDEAH